MSLMNSLKHLVIEEDPNAAQPEPTPVAQSQRASGIPGIPGIPGLPSTPAPALPVTFPTAIPNGTSDANLTATFVGKLREKFGTAPSAALLTQFTSTLESLAEAIPEEGSRFRAALKVLAKQNGVTSDQLTDAFNGLLSVLDSEAGKFSALVDKQKSQEVDARDTQVQQINAQIEGKNKEIEALMSQRDGIAMDIVAAKTKLGAATASFEGAVSSLKAEVGDSLQKMRIYFPTTVTAAKK